uniref:Uncharacterized protein n=1 Tax=Opuntia streptacantha TaxID=393608 RepID=A0A7C9A2K4_OPUST
MPHIHCNSSKVVSKLLPKQNPQSVMIKYQLKISDHIHLGISSNMWGALLAELGQQKSPKRILSTNQNQSSPSPEHLIKHLNYWSILARNPQETVTTLTQAALLRYVQAKPPPVYSFTQQRGVSTSPST